MLEYFKIFQKELRMKTKLCWKCDSFVFFWLTEVQTEVFYSRTDTAHTPFHKVPQLHQYTRMSPPHVQQEDRGGWPQFLSETWFTRTVVNTKYTRELKYFLKKNKRNWIWVLNLAGLINPDNSLLGKRGWGMYEKGNVFNLQVKSLDS